MQTLDLGMQLPTALPDLSATHMSADRGEPGRLAADLTCKPWELQVALRRPEVAAELDLHANVA